MFHTRGKLFIVSNIGGDFAPKSGADVFMSTDPLSIVAGTADAAFGTDEESRIVIWNRAAEQLLGYSASRVLGRHCCEILCGVDVYGNRFCRENCALELMVRKSEGIHRFELEIRKESGKRIPVGISIIVVPGPKATQYTLIHLLQPLGADPSPNLAGTSDSAVPVSVAGNASEPQPLTGREIEVLRMFSDGLTTREIADALYISVATVRNHTQNILRKLDVHSKAEAVSLALRNRLI